MKDVRTGPRGGEAVPHKGHVSVTRRISEVSQPRGGYVNPRQFRETQLPGGGIGDLNPKENVSPALVGMAVDYLTRLESGAPVEDAFRISVMGAERVGKVRLCELLLSEVGGLEDDSIAAALRLVGFDAAFRAGPRAYQPVEGIVPDAATIGNVRTMVGRSLSFLDSNGPKILDGLTFEGGYTDCVSKGDGDFLTLDTLWDFKVSKQKLKNTQTLQVLMYWRMGLRSIHPEYGDVRYLGVYNPRMNVAYRLDVDEIPASVISEVDHGVIGYDG